MREVLKTANRFDSIWTTFMMLPALFLMLNAGIAMYNGQATASDFTAAASDVGSKFSNQYVPYIKGTSNVVLQGVEKLSNVAGGCLSGSSAPIYTNPALARHNKCALEKISFKKPSFNKIKPYRSYH